jgi:hypothetical protein
MSINKGSVAAQLQGWCSSMLRYSDVCVDASGNLNVAGGTGGGGGTGDASAANQTTEIAKLTSIDGKVPALGQALAAASTPVVLPAAQITALTPPAAITGYATQTTLATLLTQSDFDTKSGALTETAPSTDTASSGLNGRLQRIAQRLSSLIALLPTALTGNNALRVEQVVAGPTQPVSGTLTANLGTIAGVSTEATLSAIKTTTDKLQFDVSNNLKVTGGTGGGGGGDASAANQATEIAALGAPADAEATANGSIIAVLKRIRTLLSGSLAVTGTFWQSVQPVSGTFWQATQPVSAASLPLPTGASTETTLSSLSGKHPTALAASGAMKVADIGSRNVLGAYRCGSGQIAGAASTQNLLSIENPTGSGKTVAVKRIEVQGPTVTVSLTLKFLYLVGRTTGLPTVGTTLTAQKRATADATAVAVVRQGPTATAATGNMWSGTGEQLFTAVGSGNAFQNIAFGESRESDDVLLAPGEGLLVRAETNNTGYFHSVDVSWEEY